VEKLSLSGRKGRYGSHNSKQCPKDRTNKKNKYFMHKFKAKDSKRKYKKEGMIKQNVPIKLETELLE